MYFAPCPCRCRGPVGQLARDAPATPERVLARHAFDQRNDLGVERWTAEASRFPRPEASEPATMPGDDGGGLDDYQRVRPARPSLRQNGPEGSIERTQPR